MKTPKCKYCGKEGHYAYNCWQKPRKTINNQPKSKKPNTRRLTASHGTNRKNIIKQLDREVSLLVRKSNATPNGTVYCYTCGKSGHWKEMQCGHFMSRRYMPTRFDLDQLRIQCQACNEFLSGNLEVFEAKLRKELGNQKVDEIITKAKSGQKITTPELEEMLSRIKSANQK